MATKLHDQINYSADIWMYVGQDIQMWISNIRCSTRNRCPDKAASAHQIIEGKYSMFKHSIVIFQLWSYLQPNGIVMLSLYIVWSLHNHSKLLIVTRFVICHINLQVKTGIFFENVRPSHAKRFVCCTLNIQYILHTDIMLHCGFTVVLWTNHFDF